MASATKTVLWLSLVVSVVMVVVHVDAGCRGCTRNGRSKSKRGQHYGIDCVFPFTFEGVEYNECAPGTSQPHPWCATSLLSDEKHVESWKVCSQADNVNEASPETTETCNGPLCVRKCCPAGMHFDEYYECTRHEVSLWSPSTTFLKDRKDVDESKLQILFGLPPGCSEDDLVVVEEPFKLLPDGKMLAHFDDTIGLPSKLRYCLEIAEDYDGLMGIYCNAPFEDYEEV